MIRVSQWAEIREMYFADRIPRKQIARRLGVNIKTVRRVLGQEQRVARKAPPRESRLDPWRSEIEAWLRQDPRLTAKRIGRLLVPMCGALPRRTVRRYVRRVKRDLFAKEAFVHRPQRPGDTMEVDFGESWAYTDSVKLRFYELVFER